MHQLTTAPALLSAAVAAVAGCTYPSLPMRGFETKDTAVTVTLDLDLLFVVDDSPSMADKQLNLAASFPELIKALDRVVGGRPSVHIGVVTT
jgi:hypothetical protein